MQFTVMVLEKFENADGFGLRLVARETDQAFTIVVTPDEWDRVSVGDVKVATLV